MQAKDYSQVMHSLWLKGYLDGQRDATWQARDRLQDLVGKLYCEGHEDIAKEVLAVFKLINNKYEASVESSKSNHDEMEESHDYMWDIYHKILRPMEQENV